MGIQVDLERTGLTGRRLIRWTGKCMIGGPETRPDSTHYGPGWNRSGPGFGPETRYWFLCNSGADTSGPCVETCFVLDVATWICNLVALQCVVRHWEFFRLFVVFYVCFFTHRVDRQSLSKVHRQKVTGSRDGIGEDLWVWVIRLWFVGTMLVFRGKVDPDAATTVESAGFCWEYKDSTTTQQRSIDRSWRSCGILSTSL